jgi:hypothetical protein
MASERQIAANQKNAQKSTGPRSKPGREASRHNARRHGLAIAIETDPAFQDDIEKLAKALSLSQNVDEQAREAARAEFELLRIRKIRTSLFEKLSIVASDAPSSSLAELDDKLERYERRAFSRRARSDIRSRSARRWTNGKACRPSRRSAKIPPGIHRRIFNGSQTFRPLCLPGRKIR